MIALMNMVRMIVKDNENDDDDMVSDVKNNENDVDGMVSDSEA